jgi:hypothetical protein
MRVISRAVSVLAGAMLVGASVPATAGAAITRSDFPSLSYVKTAIGGSGAWGRAFSREGPLGAKPARCRSDLPFSAAREYRSAWYNGPLRSTRSLTGVTSIKVYRFGSASSARRAMAKAEAFVTDCPKSTEWVCTNCDGVWDIRRKLAPARRVGTQSFAWKEVSAGLGVENSRVIAARTGRTVVVVNVGHQTDPVDARTPKAPSWSRAEVIAKEAIRKAP